MSGTVCCRGAGLEFAADLMGRGIVLPDDPHVITQTTTPALASGGGSPLCRPSEPATANAPGSLMLFAVVAIQPSESLDVSDAELVVEGGGKRRSRVCRP
jgi:hypothetical protein